MSEEAIDFDDDKGSTRPRMWKHFKAIATFGYMGEFAAEMEQIARAGGPTVMNHPRFLLAIAMHAFVSASPSERQRMTLAYFAYIDHQRDGRAPHSTLVPGPHLARVRVDTRVVELMDGGTQHNGTIVQVLPECVIVQRDDVWADARICPRVALRYYEFAVHPEVPPGAVGFPTGKEARNG